MTLRLLPLEAAVLVALLLAIVVALILLTHVVTRLWVEYRLARWLRGYLHMSDDEVRLWRDGPQGGLLQ